MTCESFGCVTSSSATPSFRLRTERASVRPSGAMDAMSVAATMHHRLRGGGRLGHFRAQTMMSEQLSPHYKGFYSEEVVKQRSFPVEYVLSERVMQVAPPAPSPRIPAEL